MTGEFPRLLGISQYRLAKGLTVPSRRIMEFVHGKRGVTADTALRLAWHFGTSERFWLNLQARYDLESRRTGSATVCAAKCESWCRRGESDPAG